MDSNADPHSQNSNGDVKVDQFSVSSFYDQKPTNEAWKLKLRKRPFEQDSVHSGADDIELSTAQSGADSSATTLPKRDTLVGTTKTEETEYENQTDIEQTKNILRTEFEPPISDKVTAEKSSDNDDKK